VHDRGELHFTTPVTALYSGGVPASRHGDPLFLLLAVVVPFVFAIYFFSRPVVQFISALTLFAFW